MHVLALSKDTKTLEQVGKIFPDEISEMAILGEASEFVDSGRFMKKGVFIVDYDLLKSVFANPVAFMAEMSSDAEFLFVGSHDFAKWHSQLRSAGAIVLHKPNAIGEFGIALRKIAAVRAEKGDTA